MKINALPLICAIASLAFVPSSRAVALNPFASITPGVAANAASEKDAISDAVDIANGGVATRDLTKTYVIIDDPAANIPLPGDVIAQGGKGNLSPLTAGGYYLIVKYKGNQDDGGSLVFIVDGISGDITVPDEFPSNTSYKRNEWTLFGEDDGGGGPGGNPVPDGGTSVVLLGLGLLGLFASQSRK